MGMSGMEWREIEWKMIDTKDWRSTIHKKLNEADSGILYYGVMPGERSSDPPLLVALLSEKREKKILGYAAEVHHLATKVPSLSEAHPAFLWMEREMHEKWGLEFDGNPNSAPLFRPDQHELSGVAEGAGVFHLPLGPVRADVSESGHFLFDTLGEQIMHLQVQLFWKHRGMEKMAVGRDLDDGRLLAERISGTSTVAHAVAFARAAEQACHRHPGMVVETERALFGEWERLYNHVHDMAQMASAAGMTVGQAQLSRVKEELLRMNARLIGSRYLREAVLPFRNSPVNWSEWRIPVQEVLRQASDRVDRFVDLLLRTPTFVDRYHGTGILPAKWASAYGVVGPTARASGLETDTRADWLADLYLPHGFQMATPGSTRGDALARFHIRLEEWNHSLKLVERLMEFLQEMPSSIALPPNDGRSSDIGVGIGASESPRGRVVHVLRVNEQEKIDFWGIRAASSWNWPVFGIVTANGNIQTDFPIIDASFGLSYAGNDR